MCYKYGVQSDTHRAKVCDVGKKANSKDQTKNMRLIAVGRMKDQAEKALMGRYMKRLRPAFEIIELPDGRGTPVEIKRKEARAILAACPSHAYVIALDESGAHWHSVALAQTLQKWQEHGRLLCFVIGGAEGLDASIRQRADHCLSLGLLTWPHMLVRIMLVEQLYRAQTIIAGHPYHRA